MTTAFETYQIYNAIKLHFTSDSYDYFKYQGKSRVSIASFEKRRDKYQFKKWANKFANKEDLIEFFVANFVHGDTWIGNLTEDYYREWLRKKESLSYIFQQDVDNLCECNKRLGRRFAWYFRVTDGQHPALLRKLFRGGICIETFIILNEILHFFPKWDERVEEDIIWPKMHKLCDKYKGFLGLTEQRVTQFKKIFTKGIENA